MDHLQDVKIAVANGEIARELMNTELVIRSGIKKGGSLPASVRKDLMLGVKLGKIKRVMKKLGKHSEYFYNANKKWLVDDAINEEIASHSRAMRAVFG